VGDRVGAFVGALVGAFVGAKLGALVGAFVGALVGLDVERVTSSWQKSHVSGQPFLIFFPSRPTMPGSQYIAILSAADSLFFVSHEQPAIFPFALTVNS